MKKVPFLLLLISSAVLFAGCSSSNNAPAATENANQNTTASPALSSDPNAPDFGQTVPAIGYELPSETNATGQQKINIMDFAFSPRELRVKAGQEVIVTNFDTIKHNVEATDGSFKTKLLEQNESVSFFAPKKPGTYNFVCTPHADAMKGQLIVE